MDPCHHGVADPRVAVQDTASRYGGGGPSVLGLDEGLKTPHRKKKKKKTACYEILHRASELDEFLGTT
jgi:hypothetical protein